MKRKIKKSDLVKNLAELAFGGCNDAVKLLYLDEESMGSVDDLDLRHVSELKRNSNGSVEIKFTSRLDALRFLSEIVDDEVPASEGFVRAVDNAAAALRECALGEISPDAFDVPLASGECGHEN